MKKLSILLSTLDDRIFSSEKIFENALTGVEYIIIHQVTDISKVDGYSEYYKKFQRENVLFFQRHEKGTGKSRNLALQQAQGELFFICDDDISFLPRFANIIYEEAQKNPGADILTFMIQNTTGKPYKKYFNEKTKHTLSSLAKVSNVEIVIRKSWYDKAQIKFDERFGLGTLFNTGEEFIFLSDALKQKAQIFFIPEYIVVHPQLSSGKMYSAALAEAKGAMMARVYGWKCLFINFVFALRKFKEYKTKMSFFNFLKHIYLGTSKFYKT